MTAAELALALVRTTLATSVAALVAWLLLARFKVASTRIHRAAWVLVVLQGWLIVPWTFEIETAGVEAVEAVEIIGVEAGRGRESFATGEIPLIESPQSQKTPDHVRVAPLVLIDWLGGWRGGARRDSVAAILAVAVVVAVWRQSDAAGVEV